MRKLGYWLPALVAVITTLVLAYPALATTLTLDDFQSSDISSWTDPVSPPFYTRVTWTSDGSASVGALQIQEGGEGTTSHTDSALARKKFTSAQDWSAYQTLQIDAKIDTGSQNGYSICVKNNGTYSWVHGFTPTTSYQTVKFDISGVARNQIEDIVIYVNRTGQDAGQILKIDNLLLDTASAGVPATRDIDLFETSDISTWTNPDWMPYGTTVSWVSPGAGGSAGALEIQQDTSKNTPSALARKFNAIYQDWTDYTTLEFDAKWEAGLGDPSSNGFSVLVYNAGKGGVLRAFRPTSTFRTFQIDIAGMDRDQVDKLLFYVNRTSQSSAQKLVVDNIRLTKNAVPAPPSLVNLDDFDGTVPTDVAPTWDYTQSSASTAVVTDAYSAPNAREISLIASSTSAYARAVFNYQVPASPVNTQEPTQDWQPYKSLIFEAKVIPEEPLRPPVDAGYVMNVVNGGTATLGSIANQAFLKFYPKTTWTTISLDISGMTRDQIAGLRVYINRSDKYFNVTSGQKLIIDNLRVSMEDPPAPTPTPELVDDFEGTIDTWWRFYNTTAALYSGGTQGTGCLQITDISPAGSASAYLRKTMMADWSDYKTLTFDAMMFNSLTGEGFQAAVRDYSAGYQKHPFMPDFTWRNFKIDLTGDTLDEVTGLAYYVNLTSQSNGQQLFLDNIRLSKDPAEAMVGTIGAARSLPDYTEVQIPAKVVTGFYPAMSPDPYSTTELRNVFFLEEDDRSSAVAVMVGSRVPTASATVNVGDRVTVTGYLMTGNGQRFLYARAISVDSSDNPTPAPLCLTNRAAGGDSVSGGAGLDNTCMLVTLVGQTSGGSFSPDGRMFVYMDDGSAVPADNGAVGVKVYVPMGEWINAGIYLRVTGHLVNELDPATGQVIRALWARSMDYSEIPH